MIMCAPRSLQQTSTTAASPRESEVVMQRTTLLTVLLTVLSFVFGLMQARADRWVWTTAHAIPKETTSEESGYFSIIEGHNGRIYVGTAKYRHNAYLVEYDPG